MKKTALTLYKLHGSIKSSEEGSSANLKKEDTSATYIKELVAFSDHKIIILEQSWNREMDKVSINFLVQQSRSW